MLIEAVAIAHLASLLDVPVAAETPTDTAGNAPQRYVTVEKTGGGGTNHIREADLAVQSHAESRLEAARLNERVIEAMESLAGLDDIGRCRLVSDYNWTDTRLRHYRYQAVFSVTYYG